MEPNAQIKFSKGNIELNASIKQGESVLGEMQAQIHLIAVLEEIAKATPTDLDDKALPLLKIIIGLIESKQV